MSNIYTVLKSGSVIDFGSYGPYIYRFLQTGKLIQTIQPINAGHLRILRALDIISESDPATGHTANQGSFSLSIFPRNSLSPPLKGFKGLTIDDSTQTLYAMFRSATIQDGGGDSRFTRLFAYDVSNPAVVSPLVRERVVPLPLSDKGNVEACSEIHFVSPGIFSRSPRMAMREGVVIITRSTSAPFPSVGEIRTS